LAELPGKTAQQRMSSVQGRLEMPVPQDARPAAVLILNFPHAGALHTVLIERVRHERDKHSGQISFPGGRMDPEDAHLEACALRETEEEVGVLRQHIRLAGQLTPLYIPVSNFIVTPFVGIIDSKPEFIPHTAEVERVIPVRVHDFLDPEVVKRSDITLQGGLRLKAVPYFDVAGHVVWGATAMILNEFLQVFQDLDRVGPH
jgi:8-oxo-dGTP pyrophosphatase MutT (NUDIX family)